MNEEEKKNYILKKIHENYKNMNKMMVDELLLSSTHEGLSGSHREEMWIDFFKRIIPKKFSIAQSVVIMDSNGQFSNEVDICVYDNTYTPYVFKYNNLKFIPIEAVAMVVESKSTKLDSRILKNWAESINKLKTNNTGIARMVNGYAIGMTNRTQSSTRPIKVLVNIREYSNNPEFKTLGKYFDFIVTRKKDNDSEDSMFTVVVPNKDKSLYWWGEYLNNFEKHRNEEDQEKKSEPIEDRCYLKMDHMFPVLADKSVDDNKVVLDEGLRFELNEDKDDTKKSHAGITNKLSDLEIADNPILTLNFQINQLLMLINNPMLFPHFAYANMFNKKINELEEKKNKK